MASFGFPLMTSLALSLPILAFAEITDDDYYDAGDCESRNYPLVMNTTVVTVGTTGNFTGLNLNLYNKINVLLCFNVSRKIIRLI